MTSFNIRPDDSGIRNLRNENLKPHATKPTSPVAPYPEIHPTKVGFHEAVQREVKALKESSNKEPEQELIPVVNEREQEKRHFERRQHQAPVLLDTRSECDRRELSINHIDDFDDSATTENMRKTLGIDLYT